ncbi:MAG: GNAT family N-acetyltransferase [Defluviitaleaceae bacterium]|nr:GNAT family N-acetyltransferase [Defluviitaleaceae bacterium]
MDVYMEYNLQKEIPKAVFPKGYVFKPIPREDGHIWESVMDKAYSNEKITNSPYGNYVAGDFEWVMVDNYSYLPERVFILFDEKGEPCGTATAWAQPWRWSEDYGYVIFVGVIPSHRGRGLSQQMLLSICETFKSRGHKSALLDVESEYLPAIKSYLNAGFLPCLTTDPRTTPKEQVEVWSDIFAKLKIEPLEYSYELVVGADNPHPPRPYLLDLRESGHDVK